MPGTVSEQIVRRSSGPGIGATVIGIAPSISRVVAESHATSTVSNTAAADVSLKPLTLPAGTVAVGDRVLYRLWGWVQNSSGGNINLTVTPKAGTKTLPPNAVVSVVNDATATNRRPFRVEIETVFPALATPMIYATWLIGGSVAADVGAAQTTLANIGVVSTTSTDNFANAQVFDTLITWASASSSATVSAFAATLEVFKKIT